MNGTGAARLPRCVTRAMSTLAMAAVMACCSATATSTPTASPTAVPTASPSPSATAAPSATATTSPAPTDTPAPSSTPSLPPMGWSAPQAVGPALKCDTYAESALVVAIDAASGDHAAYSCDGLIRLTESRAGSPTWATSSMPLPAGEKDLDPQLAVDGSTLYVAYTRVVPEEGCGSDGFSDVSVWYRSRALAGGAWSVARQIGKSGEHLDALRVVGGTIHVAVHGGASMVYETVHGSTAHRYTIADLTDMSVPALRVGDDGKARVAYEPGDGGITFGTFTGSGFATSQVAGSEEGWDPVMVLGKGDAAYLLWNRSPEPGGCVIRDAEPTDGTYFSTDAGGAWHTSRLTPLVGEASLTVDTSTGTVDAVVSGSDDYDAPRVEGFAYFMGPAGGPWVQTMLLPAEVQSPVIKLDTATGALLVMYETTAANGTTQSYVMRRP